MGKGNRGIDFHPIAHSDAPHGAGKITQAICGKQGGAFEWRAVEAARQMRLMMLDAMKFGVDFFRVRVECLCQRLRNALKLDQHFGTFTRKRWHAQRVKNLRSQPRVRISWYRYMVNFV